MTLFGDAVTLTEVSPVGVTELLETLNKDDPFEYFGAVPDADTLYIPPLITAAGFPVSDIGMLAIVGVIPESVIILATLTVRLTKLGVRSTITLPDLSTMNVPLTLAPR